MKSYGATIQMKATEQYFPMVLFIMLRKVVLTFESVDEILKYDHSHDSPFYLSRSFTSHRSNYLNAWNKLLLVVSAAPFKMDQNKNKAIQ